MRECYFKPSKFTNYSREDVDSVVERLSRTDTKASANKRSATPHDGTTTTPRQMEEMLLHSSPNRMETGSQQGSPLFLGYGEERMDLTDQEATVPNLSSGAAHGGGTSSASPSYGNHDLFGGVAVRAR